MDSKYTIEQEGYIEDQYSDFYYAIGRGNVQEAMTIINEVRAKDFDSIANDMDKELARKRLNENV